MQVVVEAQDGSAGVRSALVASTNAEVRRLRAVLDVASDAYLRADASAFVIDCNRAAETMFGYSSDELIGADLVELMAPIEHKHEYRGLYQQILDAAGTTQPVEVTIERSDGTEAQIELSSWVTDDDGEPSVHTLYRDVTERVALERELAEHARRLSEAQALAGVGSWEWDVVTGEVTWSAELYRIFAITEGTAVSYTTFADRLHPDDRDWVNAAVDTAALEGTPLNYEARIVRPDGDVRWIAAHGDRVTDGTGVPVRVVGAAHDITARKLNELELQRLAVTDALTGLGNLSMFVARLEAAIEDRERTDGVVSLLVLDLDRFKPVNDIHGHHVGDAVLIEISRRLVNCMREADTIARVGGDEFAVILPGADRSDAAHIARRLLDAASTPVVVDDATTVSVGASVGIAVCASPTGPGDLRRQADSAMYTAKRSDRGHVVIASA